MTNEELKKKIKEILRKRMTELLGSCHTDEIPLTEEGAEAILFYADEFADALIAAGIGEVKTAQGIGASATAMAVLEAAKAEHRAEVAERALQNACEDIKQLMDCFIWAADGGVITINKYTPENATPQAYIDRTEKELAEEEKDD